MKNIVVLVSGGGTNLQALLDAQARGEIRNGKITAVVSSTPGAFALERAKGANVPGHVVNRKDYDSRESFTIILQKAVAIEEGDTAEILQKRVMEQAEWKLLPEAVSLFCQGRLHVEGRIVRIDQAE